MGAFKGSWEKENGAGACQSSEKRALRTNFVGIFRFTICGPKKKSK